MPRIYDEERMSCRCGSTNVGPHNYTGEEHGLWECGDCGDCDYPDIFDRPLGFIDDSCPTCKKETVHKIMGMDNWSGTADFRCTACNTSGRYKIVANKEFERVEED